MNNLIETIGLTLVLLATIFAVTVSAASLKTLDGSKLVSEMIKTNQVVVYQGAAK